MRVVIRKIVQFFLHVRVIGEARAFLNEPHLIVANHDSVFDSVLLGLFLPGAPTVVVSASELRHPLLRAFSFVVRFAVLDPSQPLALKHLIRRVQRGETLAVFPQGRITTTGTLMKTYDAAATIAARCDAFLVPVHIGGALASRFSRVSGKFPRKSFPRVTIEMQAPVKLPALAHVPARERRQQLTDEMHGLMQRTFVRARPRRTLFEAFLDAVDLYGRGKSIIEDQREQPETYGQLLRTTIAVARLAGRVTAEGETVGVMLPNLSTTVALVLGLTATRRIPAMLNYSSGPDAMYGACVAAGVKKVITSRRFVQVARLEAALRALRGIDLVYLEDLRAELSAGDKVAIAAALLRPRSIVRDPDPASPAVVLFTSGSEARPKGVAISHDALLANMAQMGAVIDFGPDDKFLNALPMYHTYGLTACTLMPIMTGTPLFLYTNPLHYRVVPELAYTRDCTYIFGTSTFLGHYGRQAHPYDFYRARIVVSGGEKLHPQVAQLWSQKFGLRIMEGYGATECGPTLALNTPLHYREGTVGRFLPDVEHRIVPVAGISRGGALHVRSPNLMTGYYFYDQPAVLHPPRSEVGAGWYNTGDIVDIDEDGYVTILGRVKRFAKIAGEMVSLELVERIAYAASATHKHAATVEQLSGRGESTVLFTTDATLDRVALVKAAHDIGSQELAVARRIVKVASLPLLGSGKTDYVTLSRIAEKRA